MPAPANDSWANAILLTGASGSTTGSNVSATSEASEPIPSDGPGDGPWQSVWWKWVCPASGDYQVSLQGSRHVGGATGLDTVLGIYTGASLAALTEVESNDDNGPFTGLDNLNSLAAFTAVNGTTYYFQVSGYDNTEEGDIALAWGPPPQFTTPTITAPTASQHFDIDDDLTLLIDWNTLTGQTHYEARVRTSGGATVQTSGDTTSSSSAHTFALPYGTDGSFAAEVRARSASTSWSDWASVDFTITSLVDTPLDCLDDELLADSPDTLWIPREADGAVTEDLSGNAHHGRLLYPTMQGSTISFDDNTVSNGGTAALDAPSGAAVGDLIVFGIIDRLSYTSGSGFLDLGLPAGFSLVAQENVGPSSSLAVVVGIHDGSSTYTFTFNATAGTPALHGTSYVGGHYLHHGGSAYSVVSASTTGTSLTTPAPTLNPLVRSHEINIGATTGTFTNGPAGRAQGIGGLSSVTLVDHGVDTAPLATNFFTSASQPLMAVSLVLAFTGDPVLEELGMDTNVCDDDCTDTNYALALGDGSGISRDGSDPFHLAAEWTLELDVFIEPDAPFPGGGFYTWFALSGSVLVWIEGDDTSTPVSKIVIGANFFQEETPTKRGCWNHIVVVYDQAATPQIRVWVNAKRVLTGSTSPMSSNTGVIIGEGTTGYPVSRLGALAIYDHALTATRIKAHAAHFCQLCQLGGGWVLGLRLAST